MSGGGSLSTGVSSGGHVLHRHGVRRDRAVRLPHEHGLLRVDDDLVADHGADPFRRRLVAQLAEMAVKQLAQHLGRHTRSETTVPWVFDTSRPGPMYEDFSVGATLPPLPALTLTEADNSFYRAVTGDQHALAADAAAYRAIGGSSALVNPALVMQVSIGQSTMATRQAIANLYYRQVRVLRPVEVGETLATVTTVLGLSDSSPKGDQHRGKVWLGITTSSDGDPVVSYERCALVRARGTSAMGHADEIPGPSGATPFDELAERAADLGPLDAAAHRLAAGRISHGPAARPHRPRCAACPPDVQPGRRPP